ncbi:hemerythrin [Nocardia sp. MDA0666]|uniref:hemerythrin domain-containing protein n=1 Tax=Nocardia sp. MDA0666 TaxID=2135448 RepID=UPI000D12BD2D|nr:hemerythrin domain-containing protein [Nocardia sp. MDA0666]PSR58642.1 hemerythrin [Nocardia sp. MDA0666]
MESRSIDTTNDAVTFLREQHARIRELFDQVQRAGDRGEREDRFRELRRLLAVHETAEEEIVHPRARREVDNGAAIVDARLAEENQAKIQLADLESIDAGSVEFDVRLGKLREAVLAHAEHEEREEFAQLHAELDPGELNRMRKAVEFAEATAPTRPHPGVESATANMLAGPFASMLDRVKDAISAAGKS